MTVRKILRILHRDGWHVVETRGSHIQMKHPSKPGKVTVPNHSGDINPKTLNSILKQTGIRNI